MAKAKGANKVMLAFRKKRVEYSQKEYQSVMSKLITRLNNTGIEIKSVYFSKSSESIYVTYGINEYNRDRLGLNGYNYLGQFVISGHKRYYTTLTKTFLTTQVDSLNGLESAIVSYIETMLADKDNVHSYLTVISDKELQVLQLIACVESERAHFEVIPNQLMGTGQLDVFVVSNKRQPMYIIDDSVSSNFLRTLHVKGCFTAFSPGCSNRVLFSLTDLANEFLNEYGSVPSDLLRQAFNTRHTFDLWKDPLPTTATNTLGQVFNQSPTGTDLVDLGITLEWYQEFNTVLQQLQQEKGVIKEKDQRQHWVDLVAEFLELHLPESNEVIVGWHHNSNQCSTFYIAHDTDSRQSMAFSQLILSPLEPYDNDYSVTVDIYTMGGVDVLKQLVSACTAKVSPHIIKEHHLQAYLTIRNLERQNLAIGMTKTGVPTIVYTTKGTVQLEYIRNKEVAISWNILREFDIFDWWAKSATSAQGTTRYFSSPVSNAVFEFATVVMPYALDNIQRNAPIVPLVVDKQSLTIKMYKITDLGYV